MGHCHDDGIHEALPSPPAVAVKWLGLMLVCEALNQLAALPGYADPMNNLVDDAHRAASP